MLMVALRVMVTFPVPTGIIAVVVNEDVELDAAVEVIIIEVISVELVMVVMGP